MANSFKLNKDKTSLIAGTVDSPVRGLCNLDGTITVTWKAGTTSVVAAVSGTVLDLYNCAAVDVTTGTWYFE